MLRAKSRSKGIKMVVFFFLSALVKTSRYINFNILETRTTDPTIINCLECHVKAH